MAKNGKKVNGEEIYDQLHHHFNEAVLSKLPRTKELMEIFRIIFSPEQVECALALPMIEQGAITAPDLAEKMGKDLPEVEELVETMAREGTVMAKTNKKDGKTYYALWTLVPGSLESIYAVSKEDDERRHLSNLISKYFDNGLWNELTSSNYKRFRIIPIEAVVKPDQEILPFEEATRIIEAAETITVVPCLCRSKAKTKCDHILEADFIMGDWAEYLINYRGVRQWTNEEALKRLKECRDDGLLQLGGNAQEFTSVICNCCPCCCMALKGMIDHHNPRSFVRTNFMPEIDLEACTLCRTCQKICPMEAVEPFPGYSADGSDARMVVYDGRCIGCGLCAHHCPSDAIGMIKVRNDIPAETYAEVGKRFLEEKLW